MPRSLHDTATSRRRSLRLVGVGLPPLALPLTVLALLVVHVITHGREAFAAAESVGEAAFSIPRGATQSHEWKLDEGQFLSLTLFKGDLRLTLTLIGPGGRVCGHFPGRRSGPIRAAMIAPSAGHYTLEVRSYEGGGEGRPYRLRVAEARPATPADELDVRALTSFMEAEELSGGGQESMLRDAVEKYAHASRLWADARRRVDEAEALLRVGDLRFELSEYAAALDAYRGALALSRSAKDVRGEIMALNGIGYAHIYLGENRAALAHLHRALAAYETAALPSREDDPGLKAQTLNHVGEVYYSLSEHKKAVEHFSLSLSAWKALGERRGQALAHLNLGYTLNDTGRSVEALEHYRQALRLWEEIEDRRGMALTRTAIGGVYSLRGEKQAALAEHQHAVGIFHTLGDRQGEAATLNGIGQAYEDLGELQAALGYYQRALSLYRGVGNRDFEALTLNYIGRVSHSLGDRQQAVGFYEESVRLSRAVGDRQIEAAALKGLGLVYTTFPDRAKALVHFGKSLAIYRQIGNRRGEANLLNAIGYVHHLGGNVAQAVDHFKPGLRLMRSVVDRRGENSVLYNYARAERDRGRLDEALSLAESAVAIAEDLRGNIGSQSLRASYFASVRQQYELHIDVLMRLHRRRPDAGFDSAALRVSERARARSLLETLAEARVDIRAGVEPALLERERSLQQSLDASAEYQMRLLGGKHTREQAADVAREIAELNARYEEVREQIRTRSPRYALLTQPQALELADIQAELRGEDAVLLEYALGAERSYLWVVTPSSVQAHELPNRSVIEDACRALNELLTERPAGGGGDEPYWSRAATLSEMLLGPVGEQFRTKRLLVVADGALQYVPFDALPAPSTFAADPPQAAPLMLSHEVVSLPSVSVLSLLRREQHRPRRGGRKTIAVLADPVFEADDPRVVAGARAAEPKAVGPDLSAVLRDIGGAGAGANSLRLLSSLREAKTIMSLVPAGEGRMATGFESSRDAVLGGGFDDYRIVHFATHGVVSGEHPELSGVILSLVDAQGGRRDGLLRLHDVYNLNLSADLVVLSACRTALGKEVHGEGIIGLTRGFMYAGAESVVASLWRVDDEATRELMTHFYSALLVDGLAPAEALNAAKRAMWREGRWRHPYYWGAFILQGEYRGSFRPAPGRRVSGAGTLIPASIILLAAGALILYKRGWRGGRRRRA